MRLIRFRFHKHFFVLRLIANNNYFDGNNSDCQCQAFVVNPWENLAAINH